jgi:hypothetical protein
MEKNKKLQTETTRVGTAFESVTSTAAKQQKVAIKTPSLSLFIAKSKSGKSHLMKNILYTLARESKFSWVFVFSTTKFNNEWCDIVGDSNVSDEFNAEWLDDLLIKQSELIKKEKGKPGLIILDDMVGTANWQSNVMTKIAVSARHYNISCWISTQWYFKISTTIRGNSDYLYVLNNVSDKVAKTLHEEFPTTEYKKWVQLQEFANNATLNYGALMIDNSQGNPIIRAIRAPSKIPSYRILDNKAKSRRKKHTK